MEKIETKDMNVRKISDGSLEVSIVLNNQRYSQRYYYYSEKESKTLFKEYLEMKFTEENK